jgi:hypothetical protein
LYEARSHPEWSTLGEHYTTDSRRKAAVDAVIAALKLA